MDNAKEVYVSMIIGLLLYFTHVGGRLGRALIKGGMMLPYSEFVFPVISRV